MQEKCWRELKVGEFIFSVSNWPRNCLAALSIDVDDVHPESSEDGLDFSGDMDEGNFRYLKLLSQRYGVRFTLFVTPDWTYPLYRSKWHILKKLLRSLESYRPGTFRLTHQKYSTWREWMKHNISSGFFEVALHGLYHFNPLAKSLSQEFIGLSKSECSRRLEMAEGILNSSGIPYVKGLRPPGWGITGELLQALEERKYIFLAGSADTETNVSCEAKSNMTGLKGVSLIYPDRFNQYSYVALTANCNHLTKGRALEIAKNGGLILIHTHIVGCQGIYGVNEDFYEGVSEILTRLESEFHSRIWYATLGEVAKWWLALENISIMPVSWGNGYVTLEVNNRSIYDIKGLTLHIKNVNDEKASVILKGHDSTSRVSGNVVCIDIPSKSNCIVEVTT